MDGYAEAARPVFAAIEKGSAEEWAGLIVKAGLKFRTAGFKIIRILIGGKKISGFPGGNGRVPRVTGRREPQAERGVAPDQSVKRPGKGVSIGPVAEREEEGLVPVMGVFEVLFEKPALDRS